MLYIPSWKNEHGRVTTQSSRKNLGTLHAQLNAIILNCRNCRLRDAGKFSELILAQVLQFSKNPYRLPNRHIYTTFGPSIVAHATSSDSHGA
jgi:hypothetical protein